MSTLDYNGERDLSSICITNCDIYIQIMRISIAIVCSNND